MPTDIALKHRILAALPIQRCTLSFYIIICNGKERNGTERTGTEKQTSKLSWNINDQLCTQSVFLCMIVND
jgi:hypothetical protein